MIELITATEWASSPEIRREVFEFRHRIFVKQLGWEIPSIDSMEFDNYDALLPVNMIARDASGRLTATWRLLPTTGPYMLRNTFQDLLGEMEAPVSEAVWEISRFAFDPRETGSRRVSEFAKIAGETFWALGEFGLQIGMNEVIGVYDMRISHILKTLGCLPLWIGKPKRIGNCLAVAASFEVSLKRLRSLRQTLARSEPILIPFTPTRKAA